MSRAVFKGNSSDISQLALHPQKRTCQPMVSNTCNDLNALQHYLPLQCVMLHVNSSTSRLEELGDQRAGLSGENQNNIYWTSCCFPHILPYQVPSPTDQHAHIPFFFCCQYSNRSPPFSLQHPLVISAAPSLSSAAPYLRSQILPSCFSCFNLPQTWLILLSLSHEFSILRTHRTDDQHGFPTHRSHFLQFADFFPP